MITTERNSGAGTGTQARLPSVWSQDVEVQFLSPAPVTSFTCPALVELIAFSRRP